MKKIQLYRQTISTWLSRESTILLFAILTALLVRIYFFQFHEAVKGDGVHYAQLARNIVQGNFWDGFYSYRASLYQVMVAWVALLFELNIEFSGQIVSAFWGALLIVPIYYFGRELGGKTVGFIAVLMVIVHKMLIDFSAMLFTEPTYMFFLYSGLLFGWWSLREKNILFAVFGGLFLAIASLVRSEGVVYFLFLIMVFIVASITMKCGAIQWSVITNGLWASLSFFIVAGSFSLLIWINIGELPFTSKSTTNLILGEDVGDYDVQRMSERLLSLSIESNDLAFSEEINQTSLIGYLTTQPLHIIGRIYRNLGQLDRNILISTLRPSDLSGAMTGFFVLIVLGILGIPWTRQSVSLHLYLMAIVLFGIVTTAFFFFHPRLVLPLLPVFVLWASQGVLNFSCWLKNSWQNVILNTVSSFPVLYKVGSFAKITLGFGIIMLLLLNNVRTAPYYVNPLSLAYKSTGIWMKDHLLADEVLMADNPFVPYYYESSGYVLFPYADWTTTLTYSCNKGVEYILVTESVMVQAKFPQTGQLWDLVDTPEIDLIREFKVDDVDRIRLFRLNHCTNQNK